ncbi:hypothetical protein [Streptomyces sp. NPDC004250]|uniref:hypothetical protein n=1 Tax=Streptomyces sp. NPDC004250 TaxID=3364692 RepID=UPI00367D1983
MRHRRLAPDRESLSARSKAVIYMALTGFMAHHLSGENTMSCSVPIPQTNHWMP